MSVSVVAAQTHGKAGCGKKKCASYGACNKAAGNAKSTAATADIQEKANVLCPTVAAGGKCEHPEQCPYSHDEKAAAGKCTCDQKPKKAWYKFWGHDEKCDYCKSKHS